MSNRSNSLPTHNLSQPAQQCARIEQFIQDQLNLTHRHGVVVPISGGLDSSVVAALCVRAVGQERVLGLMLPERWGNPEARRYGRLIAQHLGIATQTHSITPLLRKLGAFDPIMTLISGRKRWKGLVSNTLKQRHQTPIQLFLNALHGQADHHAQRLIANVNAKQRVRGLITYHVADTQNRLVVGSAHQTEQAVGLFVKYGIDDAADLMPLKSLTRTQVLELARFLQIPEVIINRSPNPDILPGITDKYVDYFGLHASDIDEIIDGFHHHRSPESIANKINCDVLRVHQIIEILQLSPIINAHAASPDLSDLLETNE